MAPRTQGKHLAYVLLPNERRRRPIPLAGQALVAALLFPARAEGIGVALDQQGCVCWQSAEAAPWSALAGRGGAGSSLGTAHSRWILSTRPRRPRLCPSIIARTDYRLKGPAKPISDSVAAKQALVGEGWCHQHKRPSLDSPGGFYAGAGSRPAQRCRAR